MRIPTKLDRYPAKMVTRLADHLVDRYASGGERLLDPFCGSGAILLSAQKRGMSVSGVDINPLAPLFAAVKLRGFNAHRATRLLQLWIDKARSSSGVMEIGWDNKWYWFTDAVIEKFERLRFAFGYIRSAKGRERSAILLAFALSVRLCSRSDQKSPKPFISKTARLERVGKHYDPYMMMAEILGELSARYGNAGSSGDVRIAVGDLTSGRNVCRRLGEHSHVITSPPYINAQDYFRNFKLELYLLEGILDFSVEDIKSRFIGTERGDLLDSIAPAEILENQELISGLKGLDSTAPRLAAVVHRYFHDMGNAFDSIKTAIKPSGCFVLVCGDNLVGGVQIRTWEVLERLLLMRGFRFIERFADPIGDRMLPPKRSGHKGLIKEETVSVFQAPA